MQWIDTREMHRNLPQLQAKIEHHSDWPKAFLQTNIFLMRHLIGLVKSIVLMGRIYKMDATEKLSYGLLSLATSRFRGRSPPIWFERG